MKNLGTTIIVAIMIVAAPACAEVTFKHITAQQAARAVTDKTLNSVIAEGPAFVMSIHKRIESGHVERHVGWDEEFVMQEGEELLEYGNTAKNPREQAPGEFTADAITGGKSVMLHPGEVVTMPAGMWHQHVLKSASVRYLLFKTRKQPG